MKWFFTRISIQQPNKTNMQCPICYIDLEEKGVVSLKCDHKLCVGCFTTWARKSNTCPCCRDEFADLPEPKEQTREMPREMTDALVTQHMQELNDYVDLKSAELRPFMQFATLQNKKTTREKLQEMIDWNIRIMAARIQLFYER